MNVHEVLCVHVSGGMRISPAQLRAFMTQWVLDPVCGRVIPAEEDWEPPVLLLLSALIPITARLLCSAPFTPIDAFTVFSFPLASVFPLHYSRWVHA